MTLVAFEETFKNLLMTPQGKAALQSEETFKAFIESAPLSKKEKSFFLTQPLERYEQYEFMLFSNVADTLESLFPYTCQVLKDDWQNITQAYFWQCPVKSYQLLEAGIEFPDFLEAGDFPERENIKEKYLFLHELVVYEWTEAELLGAENPAYAQFLNGIIPNASDELSHMAPQLNLTAEPFQLTYDIPGLIAFLKEETEEEIPVVFSQPQQKFMWIYRTLSPYYCRFFELTPVLGVWLNGVFSLHQSGEITSYADTLDPIFQELAKANPALNREDFNNQFLQILSQLLENQILLGSHSI